MSATRFDWVAALRDLRRERDRIDALMRSVAAFVGPRSAPRATAARAATVGTAQAHGWTAARRRKMSRLMTKRSKAMWHARRRKGGA